MRRQISFAQYRTIDLTILAVVLYGSQFLIHKACGQWFPEQLYVVSPAAAVTALVMVRWSGWAAIHALLSGILFTALEGGGVNEYLIYGLGNLAAMAGLGYLRYVGKERIRQDAFHAVAFAIIVQLLMHLGRGAVGLLLGMRPADCLGFLTTDALSILFTIFLIWTARRVDGLLEDQKAYLLRMQKENQKGGDTF